MKLGVIGSRVQVMEFSRVKAPEHRALPFYLTKEWRDLIEAIIKERGRRCEMVGCTNSNLAGRRVFGDHVIEIQDGGAKLDRRNIMLLCGSCHTKKTNRERAKRHAR